MAAQQQDLTSVILALVGQFVGFAYGFMNTSIQAILKGDQSELIAIVARLVIIYLALMIVRRLVGMIYGMVTFAFKLALLAGLLFVGLYAWQFGIARTVDDIAQFAAQASTWLSTKLSTTLQSWDLYQGPHIKLASQWAKHTFQDQADQFSNQFSKFLDQHL